jgi:hypothetical protein
VFGAFCPLPLRLSADQLTGLSAAQYCRLAADMLAMRRLRKIARLTFIQDTTPTLVAYTGINGSGPGAAPTLATVSTGVTTITFPEYYPSASGQARPISLRGARWGSTGYSPRRVQVACSGNNVATVTVTTFGGTPVDATLSLAFDGCWEHDPTLDDYGAADNKADVSEELVPYAWTWYLEFEGMLGSGFSHARTGYVHAQKLALARLFGAGLQRSLERLACNFNPGTSDDTLERWAEIFRVDHGPSVPKWEIRQDCTARVLLLAGITPEAVNAAVETVLGSLFVEMHRYVDNDLTDPPEGTHWPGGDPGTASNGLCGYQWSSPRAYVWAETIFPNSVLHAEFHRLVNVRLSRLFDIALPAHANFGWATGDGFILDYSSLDYDAL